MRIFFHRKYPDLLSHYETLNTLQVKEQINQNACPRLLAVNMDALLDMIIEIKTRCSERLSVCEGHFLNYMVQMR